MSITGPYPSPLRIFPANNPAANPIMIHDIKYMHSPFAESTEISLVLAFFLRARGRT
jgi:hypothetical protein